MDLSTLEIGYYLINGTKRVLYFEDGQWWAPAKDNRGGASTWVRRLEKQPKVKSATPTACPK